MPFNNETKPISFCLGLHFVAVLVIILRDEKFLLVFC